MKTICTPNVDNIKSAFVCGNILRQCNFSREFKSFMCKLHYLDD